MRATAAPPVTIDLTTDRPRIHVAPRRVVDAASRDRAIAAFRATRLRRATRSGVDAAADATMAVGAAALANVAMHLNWGLPRGIAGIATGIALMGAGAAVALVNRVRSGGGDPGPATSMKPSRVIVLDEAPQVILLDGELEHSAA